MEYTDIEYELDGICYTLSFEAEFEAEDIGIGAYEYWGAKCRDVHWVNTCTGIDTIRLEDEEGNDIYDTLTKAQQDAIDDYCEEYANENAPDID
jgi:hypothetical protein